MNRGHICVSGIDPDTWKFVRPVFSSGLQRNFVVNGFTGLPVNFDSVTAFEGQKVLSKGYP